MLSTITKGFIIGIFVSAPWGGPISLLCIQRTLNKGRWYGFSTGVGATCSDLIYALLTCLGMGIVIEFVETNQQILQIIGSLLLVFFGIYIYRSNPTKNITRVNDGTNTLFQNGLTSFLLTLSNPLVIFYIITLLARFNFISSANKGWSIVVGITGIVVGALSWWFLVTTLVEKLRSNFNLRRLWIMNRIVGVVLIISSIVWLVVIHWK